ncbi:MAG: hypothetical protein Rubg2KO_10990 [Rubricoccaceae bacterium]
MASPLPGLFSPARRVLRGVVWLATVGVLALLALYASDGVEDRANFVRRLNIWIAFGLGIGTPHVLLPDPHFRLLQLANPTGRRLYRHQLERWLPILLALTAPAIVISARPPVDWTLMAEGVLATFAVGLLAFDAYARVGVRSWDWQDDRRGGGLKAFIKAAPLFRLFVPYGLVPGLMLTLRVALAGSILAIAGRATDGSVGTMSALLIGAFVSLVFQARKPFAADFYATNGFWAETFQTATGSEEEREPAPFSAMYWVPAPLKPSVWALLVSLDRRLPLGRFIVVGLAVVVGLAISGAPSGVQGAALAILILAKNAASALTASASVLPRPWSLSVQSVGKWVAARVFVNLRWTLLIAVAALLVIWLGDPPGSWLGWIGIDVLASVVAAALVTLAAESQVVRRLA